MLNESGLPKGGGVSMTTPTARERAQQRVRIFDALEKLFFKIMRKSGDCDSVPAGRTKNDLLSLTHVGGEVFRTFKTFRVELIDVLRPGRAGGEPTARRDDLQAADRCIVARCACKLRRDRFAGEFGGTVTASGESFLSAFFCSAVAGASMRV
jgi:hypothetical protein